MNELNEPIAAQVEVRLIKLKEVMSICGMCRSNLYAAVQKGQFPAPVKVGGRASAWVHSEVIAWTKSCILDREKNGDTPQPLEYPIVEC